MRGEAHIDLHATTTRPQLTILLLPVMLAFATRTGRSQEIRFDRVEGLSHNTVFAIAQDSVGFVWIGTSDGLNRYDGYDFDVFRNVPGDTTSLSNNSVKSLLVVDGGALLVGTDNGLNRFEPAGAGRTNAGFRRLVLEAPEPQGDRVAVHQLMQDSGGRVWVVSDRGMFLMTSLDRRAASYIPVISSASTDDLERKPWSVHEDAHGGIWVGANDGSLLEFDEPLNVFRLVLSRQALHLTIHGQADGGQLWLTESGRPGLLEYDPSRGAGVEPAHLAGAGTLSQRIVHTALRVEDAGEIGGADDADLVWFGTDSGLYRLDLRSGTMDHAQPVQVPVDFLQNNIKSLFADRAGALWVGTFSGLYRIDPNRKRFSHLGRDPANSNSLSGNTVMAIAEAGNDALWVGTLGGGLNRVERRSAEVTHFRHNASGRSTICSDLIWSLLVDSHGTLWVGSDDGLCSKVKGEAGFVRNRLANTRDRQPPVNALREDALGRIWAATNDGLFRIDAAGSTGHLFEWPDVNPSERDTEPFLQSLHRSRNGTMWVGAFGGDLYRFDPDRPDPEIQRVRLALPNHGELVSEGIWAIHEDTDGSLWLGSDLGLTHFDPATGVAEHFDQRDGLPGSIVYAIVDDDTPARLWMSTNRGLVRFDIARRTFRVFDAGDGIANTEFNRRAAVRTRDGTIYLGGLNGLTWFNPADIRDNPYPPPVAITRIERSRRDTTVFVNPAAIDRLLLSYQDYTVSFGYTALNFTNPSQNQYAYRLDGFDDQWVPAGTRRFATYTNIPPGNYTFRVRGSNDDGVWSEVDAVLPITVTPPFWQMLWFRLGLVLLGAGLLLGAHRYRVNRLLEVERLRVRIAGDLHDDIGSNLSSIALLSDMVQRRSAVGDRERRHLRRISTSARAMVDTLRDIVWSIDPEADTYADLVRRMRDTAAILLPGIEWSFDASEYPDPGRIDMIVRREVFLAYKETLHNVTRHAAANRVRILLSREGDGVRFQVSDDGRGFEHTTDTGGRGLRNLRERAEKLGGRADIRSSPDGGTTVSFVVPSSRRPT